MPAHLERARTFRNRAEQLRQIAADLIDSAQRAILEQAANEYEQMAEAEAAKSVINSP